MSHPVPILSHAAPHAGEPASGRSTVQTSYDTSKHLGEFSRRVGRHHVLRRAFPRRVQRLPPQEQRHVLPIRRNPGHHLHKLQKPHLPIRIHTVREVALRVYVLNAHPPTPFRTVCPRQTREQEEAEKEVPQDDWTAPQCVDWLMRLSSRWAPEDPARRATLIRQWLARKPLPSHMRPRLLLEGDHVKKRLRAGLRKLFERPAS